MLKMWIRLKWVVLLSLYAARFSPHTTAPLRVSNGLIRGVVPNDGTHARYLGIPYATMVNRFQAPGPEPTWEGIRDFGDEHIRCTQRFSNTRISGQEDCLTLNVYTPVLPSSEPRPVMVFIHGGGFRDGSGSPFLYGPQYLVRQDVILVTFNYRLEVLGFLCLGIKEAPGNVGLKDQAAALRWIKKNIQAFGGDPDNITIFGESAGSASVMYHLLSPMSKGLYHKAIMQSGSAMSPWSFQFEPLKTASQLAYQLGLHSEDPYEIYKHFMKHTPEELLTARVPRKEGDIVLSENIFVPCRETQLPGEEHFLTDIPYNIMSQNLYNKVPVIIGYNSAEGYMFIGKENDTTLSKMNFVGAMPRDLQFPHEDAKLKTAQKLKELYMGDEEITKDNLLKVAPFVGDSSISFPVVFAIDLFARTSDKSIYAYKLCHDGWMNFAKRFYGFSSWPGATHADDLFYIFKIKVPALLHEHIEWDFIQNITTMWTNFAKFSVPTHPSSLPLPDWPAVDKTDPKVLVMDQGFPLAPLWESETMRFWNSTYTAYRRKT